MSRRITLKRLLMPLKEKLQALPDSRRGRNKQYSMEDAGLSALSVFYMQSPSFPEWQRRMQRRKGKNNATSLFGLQRLPSPEQIRNLLDPVPEEALEEPFWASGADGGGVRSGQGGGADATARIHHAPRWGREAR